MAIEKTIKLNVDSTQANASLNETEKELREVGQAADESAKQLKKPAQAMDEILNSSDNVNKKLKDLDATVAKSPKNFRDLNKQIQAYQTIALQAGRESAVGRQALQRAAQLKDQMVDLQNETKRLADDNFRLQGAIGIGTGVIAGFTAFNGVMGMAGVKSEELRETMVKLQAAQAALSGITQLQVAFQKESAAMLVITEAKTKLAALANKFFGDTATVSAIAAERQAAAISGVGEKAIISTAESEVFSESNIETAETSTVSAVAAERQASGVAGVGEASIKATAETESFGKANTTAATGTSVMTNAVRILKAALVTLGLGAIIIGIGALIANFDKLKRMITGVSKEQEILNSTIDKAKEAAKGAIETVTKMKNTFALAKDGVISKEEALKEYNETIGKTIGEAETLEEAEQTFIDKSDAYVKSAMLRAQAQEIISLAAKEASEALLQQDKDQRDVLEKTNAFLLRSAGAVGDYFTAGLLDFSESAKEINNEVAKNAKVRTEQEREENQNRYAELIQSLTAQAEAIEDANDFEVKDEKDKQAAIKEARDKALAEFLARMEEYKRLRKIDEDFAQREKEWAAEEKAEREAEKQRAKETIDEIESYLDAELAKEETIRDAAIETDKVKKELAEAEIQREIALRNAKIELAQQSLTAISDLVKAFAGESEEAQRRAFNINKAISIGQAIISTAQGIITQLAVPQDALTGANFIKAGIVAATGAAQIATISATQFQASGSGGGGASSPTAPSPPTAVSTPATFNVVGNTGTNQLAETLGQQPLQAYVVAGDVTTAQSLERNKIQQSTL